MGYAVESSRFEAGGYERPSDRSIWAFGLPRLDSNTVAAGEDNRKLIFPVEEPRRSLFAAKVRYWWCWTVAATLLLVVGIPSLLFLWLIKKKRALYPIALWGARTWLKACGARLKVTGLENLDPDRQYVFASNHRSYLDTAALFVATGKRIGLVAKKELLKVPVLGQGMGFVNIIAIDRSNPERAMRSMQRAREVVDEGYSFGIFVEGTRAMPGELLPFKKGAFYLALQTQVPILPVAIKNTDRMMAKKAGVAYPGEVEVVIKPSIPTFGKTAEDVNDLLLQTRSAIAAELSR